MGDKSKKKKKPKAKASRKVDKTTKKPSQPPDWARATRYEIYDG